jgi:pimeloyl-ACP methyl ester carboxylesterase
MAGALDPVLTIDTARERAEALPQEATRFVEFEDAGHMLGLRNQST